MRRETVGGWAMIAGAATGLVVMALHPTGGGHAALARAVHVAAIVAAPVVAYGGWVLSRRLAAASAMAELAFAFHCLGAVATVMAGTASGFLTTPLIAQVQAAGPGEREAAAAVLGFSVALNQAFAWIIVAASSVAIGLWSAEIVRTRLLRRATGWLGCVVATVTAAALLSGHLRLDVHGFGAVVLAQAVWLVAVGAELRHPSRAVTS